jgi:hypothetical protein
MKGCKMANQYTAYKAAETARAVCRRHDIDFPAAIRITESIWAEARSAVLRIIGKEDWQKLSFSEKSAVCQIVVKGLLDKRRLAGFLSGVTKSIC